MGYESRIIVAEKCKIKYNESYAKEVGKEYYEFSVMLADMRLSCMPRSFTDIFTNPVEWELLGEGFEMNSDKEFNITKDMYGDLCCYTDLQTVIDYLEKSETEDHYRRNNPAIAMLKAYAAETWDYPLIVIHYGY